MSLVDRVRNILLTPKTEWGVIAAEPTSTGTLISSYVVPLAGVSAAAGLVGSLIFGAMLGAMFGSAAGLTGAVIGAIVMVVMSIIGTYVLSIIINLLAPTFGGQKNDVQALKVAAYSMTAVWVAGLAQVVPFIGFLVVLVGGLYGIFLMYLGLTPVMRAPEDKAPVYTLVVAVCAIVLGFIMSALLAAILGAGLLGGAMIGGLGGSSSTADAQFDPDSPLGRLEALGDKLEESNKKMEAAAKSGDAEAQVNAALEGLGTLFGGGKRVEPVNIDVLKPLVPETFAGLPRTATSAEKTGIANLMISRAEANYGDAEKHVSLEISDTGGVSGLMGLASWVGVQGEQENDQGSERTYKADGRLVHEKMSKTGGQNEYGLVIADRFMVTAEGRGVDLATLKAAVSSLDLAKLESLKDTGVQR